VKAPSYTGNFLTRWKVLALQEGLCCVQLCIIKHYAVKVYGKVDISSISETRHWTGTSGQL
jgi:hypothetical protein